MHLTPSQVNLILSVGSVNGAKITTSEISKQLRVTYDTVFKARKKLHNDGILTVRKIDKRSKSLFLTPKGENIYMHLKSVEELMGELKKEVSQHPVEKNNEAVAAPQEAEA